MFGKSDSKHCNPIDIVLLKMVVLPVFFLSCSGSGTKDDYKTFPGSSWARFNLLEYEIPVEGGNQAYDVYFYAWVTQGFEYDTLPINMVMLTPSGEERIMEYQMGVNSNAVGVSQKCKEDSCLATIALKKMLFINKGGKLKVTIENLNPRLVTQGIKGAGIRVEKSGQ